MKRFLAILMSFVLVVGLMPVVPYGGSSHSAWADDVIAAVVPLGEQGYAEPVGLQLNVRPFSLKSYGVASNDYRYCVLPSDFDEGGVVFAFEGKAPRLVIADASGSALVRVVSRSEAEQRITTTKDVVLQTVTCSEDAPAIAWKDSENTVGVELFSADTIRKAVELAGHEMADVGRVYCQADGGDVTVNRVVLTRTDLVPDVSGRGYGTDQVRRVYTRPVSIKTAPDSGQRLYRTTSIDIFNPVFDGADIAVRYTCPEGKEATPFLQLCRVTSGGDWVGWTSVTNTATWGVRTAVDEETGERVTFFDRDELERVWKANGGKDGDAFDYLYVNVHVQSSAYPEGSEQCDLIEVVALGGDARVELTDEQLHQVSGLSADEIVKDMRAGYNMAGHFESNYVPEAQTKDGGWGQSDLALEAHWARGTYITRENIHALKEKGFNAIRLPVTWFQHIYAFDDPTGAKGDPTDRADLLPTARYHIDRAWLDRVHEVVDWCIAENMFVIVNMHHEDWIDRQDLDTAYESSDLPVKFAAVWTQIADEFSGYDQRLVFEDMNEPHMWYYEKNANGNYKLDSQGKKVVNWGFATEGSVTTVNRLNDDFVKLMRGMPAESGHQDRLLMMAHDTGGGEIATTGFIMPDDGKSLLAHSLHCYSPHDWTHYFANGNHRDETGELDAYTESYRASVEAKWESYRLNYISQGEPIVLGEFGCYYLGESAERKQDRIDWMTQYATHAKELGMPMFYWRMDRTKQDENGKEYVEWSAFDEETHEFSMLSREMLQTWLDILNDPSIPWGSAAEAAEGEHADLSQGKALGSWPVTIRGNHNGTNDWRVTFDGFTWDDVAGNEIAVKYTGSTPRIGMLKGWDGDWWGVAPDTVDYQRGIAYFKSSTIEARWNAVVAANAKREATDTEYRQSLIDAPASHISRLLICTDTSGSSTPLDETMATTIEAVSIVPVTWTVDKAPTCTEFGKKTLASGLTTLIPSLGHSWGAWSQANGDQHQRVCTHDEDHVQLAPHEWGEGATTTAAGPVKAGVLTYTCALCGATKTEAIPATGRLSMSGAKVTLTVGGKTLSKNAVVYTGKAQKPSVTVKSADGKTLKNGKDYKVGYLRGGKTAKDFTSAGTISVKVSALDSGDYKNSKTATFTIGKASQSIAAKKSVAKSFKGKRGALATTKTFSLKSLGKVSAKTTVAYAKANAKGGKLIAVSKKGVVTVKKGLAKGLYAVKVKLTAPAGTNYKAASAKTITVNVRVK